MTLVKFNGRPVVKYNDPFSDFFNLPSLFPETRGVSGSPAANIYETSDAYHIDLNVPGRNREDFKVNVEKDLLTVSYEKKGETKSENSKSIRREFTFNSFKRTFSLDQTIDVSKIQAKYDNGILKIELPKKEEVKAEPKQIAIN
jgi:HSP20 family protein